MLDFWMSLIWTLLVTLATLLADWIAARVILLTRAVAQIRLAVETPGGDPLSAVKKELERIRARQVAGSFWGADLAAVAIGLDLAVLGLWMANHTVFPFFQRWNVGTIDRSIGVWLVLLLVHVVLLFASIVFKHFHGDHIETLEAAKVADMFRAGWVRQNRWMLLGNGLGFLGLLSSFIVVANAI